MPTLHTPSIARDCRACSFISVCFGIPWQAARTAASPPWELTAVSVSRILGSVSNQHVFEAHVWGKNLSVSVRLQICASQASSCNVRRLYPILGKGPNAPQSLCQLAKFQ